MAKAQKRGNKEARKPKKEKPKASTALAIDKHAVKLPGAKGA